MRRLLALLPLLGFASPAPAAPPEPADAPSVILLHGLARSARSMDKMAEALGQAGFTVCNIDYPSRHHPVEDLAMRHVLPQIQQCLGASTPAPHFVTHSMGGIIVRQLAASGALPAIGRVVMLGPPNGGSEVVDSLADWPLVGYLNGPAGRQLGTGDDELPQQLGPARFEAGVIAGSFSINPLLSLLIPGEDDGKVSLARARLDGMRDYRVMPVSHPLMMRNSEVIEQTIHFLRHGRFLDESDQDHR